MKKLIGIQAEVNITADEGIIKGFGKGIEKGSIKMGSIIDEVKPAIVKAVKDYTTGKEVK